MDGSGMAGTADTSIADGSLCLADHTGTDGRCQLLGRAIRRLCSRGFVYMVYSLAPSVAGMIARRLCTKYDLFY
jgi:hypothetical protein